MVIRGALIGLSLLTVLSLAAPMAGAAPGGPGAGSCAAALSITSETNPDDTDIYLAWTAVANRDPEGLEDFKRDLFRLVEDPASAHELANACKAIDVMAKFPALPQGPDGELATCLAPLTQADAIEDDLQMQAQDVVSVAEICRGRDRIIEILDKGIAAIEAGKLACPRDDRVRTTTWLSMNAKLFSQRLTRDLTPAVCRSFR